MSLIIVFFMTSFAGATDRAPLINPNNHKVRQAKFWTDGKFKGSKLEQKIYNAPAEIIDYLTIDNAWQSYSEVPKATKLDAEFRKDLVDAIKELPPKIKSILNKHVLGIFVVNDLGTSGTTNSVQLSNKKDLGSFIVLDRAFLDQKANDFFSFKENSPFKSDDEYRIVAEAELESDNNRKNAIQFLLLHELGHVLGRAVKAHPDWNQTPNEKDHPQNYGFSKISWMVDKENKYVTLVDAEFPERRSIRYYASSTNQLPSAKIPDIYEKLEKTGFVSLYSTNNPFEDFAESFQTYVHNILMKRPWNISILRGEKVVKTYKLCWGEIRCQKKEEFLKKTLKI